MSIAAARALPDGTPVVVEGTVTLAIGGIDGGRGGFMQDATAGIGIYLDAVPSIVVPAGSTLQVTGVVATRYAERVLRVGDADVVVLGASSLPAPVPVVTGEAGEPNEGLRLVLTGTVTEAPSALADGLGMFVDDGTGPVRVVVGADALGTATPHTGDIVTATGPLGQRDSGGTGLAGYRLYAMLPGELAIAAAPTPTPTAAPTASPSPTTSPTPTPTPLATPSAAPTPTPSATSAPTPTPSPTSTPATTPLAVAAARAAPVGRTATVRGVVIAEAGRLGTPPLLAIGDTTGGLPVKLADDMVAPARGTLVEVRGTVADPYGQTELRLATDGLVVLGFGTPPAPVSIEPGAVGEATEGRLALLRGTITASAARATSGDVAFTIEGSDGTALRVTADGSAGLDAAVLRKGASVTLVGVVGQRASRKGALDGYRLWVRDRADVTITTAASPSPTATTTPTPATATVQLVTVARALAREGDRVTVEGTITVDRTLLDTSGRRTVVEDGTGAIELYLDAADTSIHAGVRVRATGTVGRAWGAPRLRVEALRVLGTRMPGARDLKGAPGETSEWRLVRVRGTIEEVHRSGDRWTAELVDGRVRIPLLGLPGGAIASTALVEGRRATVIGIVKRPYPTATDRRFAVVPRSVRDLDLGRAPAASAAASTPGSPGPSPAPSGGPADGGGPDGGATAGPDIHLADLAANVGRTVRVGGLVAAVEPGGVRLDDGSATALVVLEGAAADLVGLLQPGDAVNATGTPDERGEVVLVVTDPAGLVLVGELGATDAASGDPGLLAGLVRGDDGRLVPGALAGALGDDAPAPGLQPFAAILGTLLLTALLGAAVVTYRAARTRRLARARIQARLDAIGATPAPGGPVAAA